MLTATADASLRAASNTARAAAAALMGLGTVRSSSPFCA
jgi:hypothetical protein